uniref:CRM domain-containing protein n=1 Tax=Kalanchoe fedtschenkoi TaxID=63787 RepID=A0A7N0RCK6_KALFE
MALKLSDMPSLHAPFLIFSSAKRSSFIRLFCAIRTTDNRDRRPAKKTTLPWKEKDDRHPVRVQEDSWITKWTSSKEQSNADVAVVSRAQHADKDPGQSAIQRIVLRLRNLGLPSDDEEDENDVDGLESASPPIPFSGDEKLGDLLKRDWVRPDSMLLQEDEDDNDAVVFPWDRNDGKVEEEVDAGFNAKRKVVKAPTLAELTIEDGELRRLRRMGMTLRERVNVAKAGVTQAVVEKMHDKWRNQELVRLKFHESLAHDMKTAHELVERRSGGLIIWRAGSVMVVYRGSNYEGPAKSQSFSRQGDSLFIPDVSSEDKPEPEERKDKDASSNIERSKPATETDNLDRVESMTEEEAEYNRLLDGLGPRFVDWWSTGVLPVDADLLPPSIPGYKTPFRLLPNGMRSHLTNAEMTNLRKLARSLPCHFALGRNRNHQGLAAAIIKLWEKSLVVKIAVKRGIQNTNNKLMAEEIQSLTGGVLLLRNKFYIVIYRGKDFLPTCVAAALAERQELTKQIQDVEEKVRTLPTEAAPCNIDEGHPPVGSLAEFYEAQARWGKDVTAAEREKMIKDVSIANTNREVKRIEHKLELAQAKKLRAEKILSKIEASMVPIGPCDDQETITDEERSMFRRVGLKMKAYLPLGIRGVFDGVIENMHLHWKHRELVKLISKQKTLVFVEETARLLEYESGGILVSIDPVPKGYTLIYYRGKNYRRPVSLRPRNLLTKAKALKRSVAMQRHEALSQHITDLEGVIEQMKVEIGDSKDLECLDACRSSQATSGSESFRCESEDLSGFENEEGYIDDNSEDDEAAILSRFEEEDFFGKVLS